jgi:hypothetical protein
MQRKLWALLAALVVFVAACGMAALLAPYALGLFYHCVPPSGSCGDTVGWAMILSAPVSVPLTLLISGVLAAMTYRRVTATSISSRSGCHPN